MVVWALGSLLWAAQQWKDKHVVIAVQSTDRQVSALLTNLTQALITQGAVQAFSLPMLPFVSFLWCWVGPPAPCPSGCGRRRGAGRGRFPRRL
jgi:hypothetical protein